MNPKVVAKNREFLRKYRHQYPFEVILTNNPISPATHQRLNPAVKFAFVPLPEGRHWLFLTEQDLNHFKEMAKCK